MDRTLIAVVLVAVAAGVLAFLTVLYYGESISLKGRLDTCKAELSHANRTIQDLRVRLGRAENTIAALRANLSKALSEAEALRARLNRSLAELSEAKAELEKLGDEHRRLKSMYESLSERFRRLLDNYTTLRREYSSLKSSYESILKRYSLLEENYTRLRASYEELKDSYEKLRGDYERLSLEHARLQQDYETLSSRYNELRNEYYTLRQAFKALKDNYTRIKEEYNTLQTRYSMLEENYTTLLNKLENTERELASITDKIRLLQAWYGLEEGNMTSFYTKLLDSATSIVKRLVDIAGFSGDLGERSLQVFQFILTYLSYCPDNYVRLLSPYNTSTIVWDDVLMMPNETWLNGCGDCEDLALLAYALLQATIRSGEKLYLIAFTNTTGEGHVGVLAVRTTPTGEKHYYVIDPAGNYLTGIGMYYVVRVKAPNGTLWRLYLNPLSLEYDAKKLLRQLAETAYYDYSEGKWINEPIIYYYTDPMAALHDWIVWYWSMPLVSRIVVIAPGVYKEFETITDAANWIASHS